MPFSNPLRIALLFMLALIPLLRCGALTPEAQSTVVRDATFDLVNGNIEAKVIVKDSRLEGLAVADRIRSTSLTIAAPFAILLGDGTIYDARNLRITAVSPVHALDPNPNASRLAERRAGQKCGDHAGKYLDRSLRVAWRVVLRSDANYVRQELTITAAGPDVAIRRVQLIDLQLSDAHVSGSVDGSPIVAGHLFLRI